MNNNEKIIVVKKKMCTASRYNVLASIHINRVHGNKTMEQQIKKESKSIRKKSEAELLIEEVNKGDGKDYEIVAQVEKIAPARMNQDQAWYDDFVETAVKKAAIMHARSILSDLRAWSWRIDHVGRDARSKTLFADVRVKAVFKVCARGDEKVAGFSVCSPSDTYDKHDGTEIASLRYERALHVIEHGRGGKKYPLSMVVELGASEFGVVVGENDVLSRKKKTKKM